jgi:WhiB family transcriptional regulator, redox-sensing transcriptional regulator
MTRRKSSWPGAWVEQAACRGMTIMEIPDTQNHGRKPSREAAVKIEAARIVCRRCPVIDRCLDWAMGHPDPAFGMMAGGLTPVERSDLRRKAAAA